MKLIKRDHNKDLLVKLFPESEKFIRENDESVHYYFLDDLEEMALNEVRRSLEGDTIDQENAKRAAEMLKMVAQIGKDELEVDAKIQEKLN